MDDKDKLNENKSFTEILENLEVQDNELEEEKNNILKENRFVYQEGDLEISKTQCELCKYNKIDNKNICKFYPDGKPSKITKNMVLCKNFEDK